MEKFVVIMAGGVGSRFWPRSRKRSPKQLLNIFGEHSMIQNTVYRLKDFVKPENIFIITNKVQKALIEDQLPELNPDHIIAEPIGRNTAPCVGLSSLLISEISKDGVIVTLPADHLIHNNDTFLNALESACGFAYEEKALVTFGIKPTRPETGYGYINVGKEIGDQVYKVNKFVEKPDHEKAQEYLKDGNYLWNSGMFIWRTDVIFEEMSQYLPNLHNGLCELIPYLGKANFYDELNDKFPDFQNISIDYGIMEKSQKVYSVKGDFGWSDVGSWETVYELSDKDDDNNSIVGDVITKFTKDSYIYSPDKFTGVIGVDNLVIINTNDALLVCSRDKVQDVKKIVEHLNEEGRTDLT